MQDGSEYGTAVRRSDEQWSTICNALRSAAVRYDEIAATLFKEKNRASRNLAETFLMQAAEARALASDIEAEVGV